MIFQFIHLIVLCYGCTELAGYYAQIPHIAAALWLFFSFLIIYNWLPNYTEKQIKLNHVPPFFKTYNIFCFFIVFWVSALFVFANPLSFFGNFFISKSSSLTILLAMFLYLFFLKHFMASLYEMLEPVLQEDETSEEFLRARQTVPIIFFPPIIIWLILEDLGINDGMELMSEIRTLTLAPIFLLGLYILSPRLFNWAWKTNDANSSLSERLINLCNRANTKIAGVKIWNTFNEPLPNAAVAGLISKFRFIYITDYILKVFSEEQIEAVVAHEIGHLRLGHVTSYLLFSINAILIAVLLKSVLIIYYPYFYIHSTLTYTLEIILFIPLFAIFFTALARYCEKQADLFSAVLTKEDDFVSSMKILNILVGSKPKYFPKWLLTHPEIEDRIKNVRTNTKIEINSLITNGKVIRYLLLVMAIALFFISAKPVSIVFKWSNLYNAAQAGNCRLVTNICNSLPEWLSEHPFVLEQRVRTAMNSGKYCKAAIIAFKAYFGVDIGLVLKIPHHSGSPKVAFDLKIMQLVLKFFNFS